MQLKIYACVIQWFNCTVASHVQTTPQTKVIFLDFHANPLLEHAGEWVILYSLFFKFLHIKFEAHAWFSGHVKLVDPKWLLKHTLSQRLCSAAGIFFL